MKIMRLFFERFRVQGFRVEGLSVFEVGTTKLRFTNVGTVAPKVAIIITMLLSATTSWEIQGFLLQ